MSMNSKDARPQQRFITEFLGTHGVELVRQITHKVDGADAVDWLVKVVDTTYDGPKALEGKEVVVRSKRGKFESYFWQMNRAMTAAICEVDPYDDDVDFDALGKECEGTAKAGSRLLIDVTDSGKTFKGKPIYNANVIFLT